ncbi:MAG: peptide-methionine (S)-S-oxide reductase MsrA [Anaerolineaceae bacterium]|nr:peptide-methionine (S)-S-oxide reductase MsrA [Anaerolineaceae bacterium]
METPLSSSLQSAVLAGGCFWCLEAVFEQVRGVSAVVSGYTGGHRPSPSYEQVCTGLTGHAESVRITFDPAVVSYPDLLHIFFTLHDPTTLDRQGADVGSQYRSAIFYADATQKAQAEAILSEMGQAYLWPDPIVTQLLPLDVFYPAEEYHQHYFARNPQQGYCQFVVAPKVAKFRQKYQKLLKTGS